MGYYNPYQPSPYGSPYGGYPSVGPQSPVGGPQPFGGQITRVNGPNSSILLMDENDPIVWLNKK